MPDTEQPVAGPATWQAMSHDQRMATLRSMVNSGGSFTRRLAEAWFFADSANSRRLAAAFPELVQRYGPGGPMHGL